MDAPNKIYLPSDIDWPSVAILTLGNQDGDIEYIRKDTLLKWLTAEQKRVAFGETEWISHTIQDVIDKINSL